MVETKPDTGPRIGWKRIWPALALVLAIAVAGGLLWKKDLPPQIITLQDGQQYRFAGVSYGTRHVQPTLAAHFFNVVPSPMTNAVRWLLGKHLGPIRIFRTAKPSLCVWFETIGTNKQVSPFLQVALADQNGVVAGKMDADGFASMAQWPYSTFEVIPRRSRELQCILFRFGMELGRVRFPNPAFGQFPQWQPEALPAARTNGELVVRLDHFTTGTEHPNGIVLANGELAMRVDHAWMPEVPKEWTVFDLALGSLRGAENVWVVESADLSDATGNHIYAIPYDRNASLDGYRKSFKGALWPDEAAWRLKLELRRTKNFALADLVTFSNVPVPVPRSQVKHSLTHFANGIEVILALESKPADSWTNALGQHQSFTMIRGKLPSRPAGVTLDFAYLTTINAEESVVIRERQMVGSRIIIPGDDSKRFACMIVLKCVATNAPTADITLAVQKTRTVEFLVKPPKPQ